MTELRWEWITVAYATYLAAVAAFGARFQRARGPTLVAAFAAWTVWSVAGSGPRPPLLEALLPIPILLAGYWLSGLFFVRPMIDAEAWLLRIDRRLARAWSWPCPWLLRDYLELAYVLVYAVVPAGALTLVFGDHVEAVPRFWAAVLLAEFVSYGALPWIQTRPPRAIDPASCPPVSSALRRFNIGVLRRASNQVNTLPSGHAAGAVATALVVASVMPGAGFVFLVIAISIVVATVVGRYHYAVDSVLGAAVAMAAVWVVG
jgi:membrane-associated phospholipid phosphatase